MKILEYEWVRGAQPYLLIMEGPTTPDTAEWFGVRLRIRHPGEPDVLIVDSIGWGLFHPASLLADSSKFAPTVIGDDDLYLLPSIYGNAGPPSLAIIGYQFGSSPGSFRLLTVAADGKPTAVLYLKNFDPLGPVDLDGDGVFELVGKREWGEGMSDANARGCALGSYAPFTVFRFQGNKVPQVVEDSTLSRRYNQEHYVWYDGPDPDHALVQWCPGGRYKLSQTND